MNASERNKFNRALNRLTAWKAKAVKRNIVIGRLNKKIRYLEESRDILRNRAERRKEIILFLEDRIETLEN